MDNFHLQGEDDGFKTRINDIYSGFDDIKNNSQLKFSKELKSSRKRRGRPLKETEPGFKTEPDKWVKYSLESTEVANDRQNTQAALSFLHELSKRSKVNRNSDSAAEDNILTDRASADEQMDTSSKKKVCFKKPVPHTMMEYVVGKPKSRGQSFGKSNNKTMASFDKVELDHLEENVSAVEYQANIEAKLDETLQMQNNTVSNSVIQDTSDVFKSNKLHKSKRNIRKRN